VLELDDRLTTAVGLDPGAGLGAAGLRDRSNTEDEDQTS
jgi:hypothetical protein